MTHSDEPKNNSNVESETRSLAPYREPASLQIASNGDFDFEDERSLGVRDYWLMVRNRLWLILAITFLVTILALIYVARQPDVYAAEARIQVDLENNPALGGAKNGLVIINTPGDETAYFNTQLLLLQSPTFLRRVVKTLNLEQGPNAFAWNPPPRTSTWQEILRIAGLARTPSLSERAAVGSLRASSIAPSSADSDMAEEQSLAPYVAAIGSQLDVKLSATSRLININFSHSDPVAAARVANVVADTFVTANWERRAASTSTAGDFLKTRIDELKLKISENEKRLIEYAKTHQVLPLDSTRDIESDRIATLDKVLLDAENARKSAELEYQAALAPGAAAAIVEASNNGLLTSLDSRLAELRQKRAIMLIETGENWPEVKELNKQIALLDEQSKQTRENAIRVVLTNLETRYKQALAREQSFRTTLEKQRAETMNQNAEGIEYRMIQQETTTLRGLLDSLFQRSKENDVILAATPNNVHVTDYATLPVIPFGPRRLTIVAVAFGLSLALSVGFTILIGTLEDSVVVDSVERVERMFGLPALAVVPTTNHRRQLRGIQALLKPNGNGRAGLLLNGEMRSALAESYRKLRTSVFLSTPNRVIKTLLVTSSLPAEGKTTAVINMGLVMSQTGSRVLLIDADLRHPTLHEILGIDNERGLTTILSSDLSEAEALSMIERYGDSNLYVLAAGPLTNNPAELLGSERMKRLIGTLDSSFSHIIIDSPPISFFTDSVLVSLLVDGVLMIVRGPKTPRQIARCSLQSLDAVGAPILGVVLNAVNVRANDYTYYRNYYR